MNKYFLYLSLLVSSVLTSCEYENAELEISKSKVQYSKDILPIIMNHCSVNGCHVNGSVTGNFTDYNQLKEKINTGKFQLMVFDYKLMPPASYSKLSPEEYALFHRWIDEGAMK